MKLTDLLKPLKDAAVVNQAEHSIRGLELDSRRIRPGYLFAVVPGRHDDGRTYVADAIERGAVAILSPEKIDVPAGVSLILVPHVRRALADLCCRFYGYPADLVRTVGVTGTNGKSTVVTLLRSLLTTAGKQAALLSTVVHQIGSRRVLANNTTPESTELQAYFAEMVERHIRYAAMEVSSHSLDQERVRGIRFAVAAFTNLTNREHLDYHKTFEAYRDAKGRLFESLAVDATAVLNREDPTSAYYAERTRAHVVTYALDDGGATVGLSDRAAEDTAGQASRGTGKAADIRGTIEEMRLQTGMVLRIQTPGGSVQVRSPLVGRYNAMNLLAGVGCALALGMELGQIAAGIERFTGAPGRLERVEAGQPFTVLVDYAHNEDGLRSVLGELRPLAPKRLIVLFGAGGERDHTKRPKMGEAAAALADFTVLTSDNSRSERTEDIIAEIAAGMPAQAPRLIEPDRREAIRKAVQMARPGDLLVLAGKGHETYQDLGGVRYDFDDREEVRRALLSQILRRGRELSRGALSATAML